MLDIVAFIIFIVCFGLSVAYSHGCDRHAPEISAAIL